MEREMERERIIVVIIITKKWGKPKLFCSEDFLSAIFYLLILQSSFSHCAPLLRRHHVRSDAAENVDELIDDRGADEGIGQCIL